MALSTTQYGYIIDPMVPFTAPDGRTIRNGYAKVFLAGSSTPVITYANFDGTANQERIELDNSGRTATKVIGSKGSTYKVCVYDAEHSQEAPILTVDKVQVIGASVSATNVVQGLDNVEGKTHGWVKVTVSGTSATVAMDPSNVVDEITTESGLVQLLTGQNYTLPIVSKNDENYDVKADVGRVINHVMLGDGSTTPPAGALVYAALNEGLDVTLCVGGGSAKQKFYPRPVYHLIDGTTRRMIFEASAYSGQFKMIVDYLSSDNGNTWTTDKFYTTP